MSRIVRHHAQDSSAAKTVAKVSAEVVTTLAGTGLVCVGVPRVVDRAAVILLHEMSHWAGYAAVCGFDPRPYLTDFCDPRQIVYPTRDGPPSCSLMTEFLLYAKEHGAGWSIWQVMTYGSISDTPIKDQFAGDVFSGLALYRAAGDRNITSSALGSRLGVVDAEAYYTLSGVFSDAILTTSMAFVLGHAAGVAFRGASRETLGERAHGYAGGILFLAGLHFGILAVETTFKNASTDSSDIQKAAIGLAVDRGADADALKGTLLAILLIPPLVAPMLGLAVAWRNSPVTLSDRGMSRLLLQAARDEQHPEHTRAREMLDSVGEDVPHEIFVERVSERLAKNPALARALIEALQTSLGIENQNTWAKTTMSMTYPLAMMLPAWHFLENANAMPHEVGQTADVLAIAVGGITAASLVLSHGQRFFAQDVKPPASMTVRVLRGLEDTCMLTAGISFVAAGVRGLQGPPGEQSVESALGWNPDYVVGVAATAAGWIFGAARGFLERRSVRAHVDQMRVPRRVRVPEPESVPVPVPVPVPVLESASVVAGVPAPMAVNGMVVIDLDDVVGATPEFLQGHESEV